MACASSVALLGLLARRNYGALPCGLISVGGTCARLFLCCHPIPARAPHTIMTDAAPRLQRDSISAPKRIFLCAPGLPQKEPEILARWQKLGPLFSACAPAARGRAKIITASAALRYMRSR